MRRTRKRSTESAVSDNPDSNADQVGDRPASVRERRNRLTISGGAVSGGDHPNGLHPLAHLSPAERKAIAEEALGRLILLAIDDPAFGQHE